MKQGLMNYYQIIIRMENRKWFYNRWNVNIGTEEEPYYIPELTDEEKDRFTKRFRKTI